MLSGRLWASAAAGWGRPLPLRTSQHTGWRYLGTFPAERQKVIPYCTLLPASPGGVLVVVICREADLGVIQVMMQTAGQRAKGERDI
jgi:hypothetical protein